VKQCAILFVNPDRQESPHPDALQGMGFVVDAVTEWPDSNEIVRNYHVVIVRLRELTVAPMVAARLRAKPHFGRRLLIALATSETSHADRRAAEASGFDEVLDDRCNSRHLATRILRGLKTRPELRCALPPLTSSKRSAA
jgi:CheY-like chemotaxis protein